MSSALTIDINGSKALILATSTTDGSVHATCTTSAGVIIGVFIGGVTFGTVFVALFIIIFIMCVKSC